MEGNINAIGIIITPILTAILIIKFGAMPKKLTHILASVIITLVVYCFGSAKAAHYKCDEGQGFFQWLIPSLCFLSNLLFIKPKIIRWIAATVVFILMFYLCFKYDDLVHKDRYGGQYTGNPEWRKQLHSERIKHNLEELKKILSEASVKNDTNYPAGWLSDSEIKQLIPESKQYPKHLLDNKSVKETYKFWHTPITRLYGVTYQRIDIWYPGGLLEDCINKLEFKER